MEGVRVLVLAACFSLGRLFGFLVLSCLFATGNGIRNQCSSCLVFRRCIEVRCEAPDLYIGVFCLAERLTDRADCLTVAQNADCFATVSVATGYGADNGFRGLTGKLPAADFHVAGGDHCGLFYLCIILN